MHVKHFLSDSLIIGFLNGDPRCSEILMRMDPDNLGMIPENCRIYLERYISEGYKDVAQQIPIAIWEQRDNPRMQDHPGAFATEVNRNKIIDELRKIKRSKETLDSQLSMRIEKKPEAGNSWMDNQICSDPSVMDNMIEEELVKDQKELLMKLLDMILEPDDSTLKGALRNGRIALFYRVSNNFSIDKIAKIMNAHRETVKSWIHRYVKHLCKELEKQGWNQSKIKEVRGF